MKRITFVLIGIMVITTLVLLSQKKTENKSSKIVKVDVKKSHVKDLYD